MRKPRIEGVVARLLFATFLALSCIPTVAAARGSTRASRSAPRSAAPASTKAARPAHAAATRPAPGVPQRAVGRATYGYSLPNHHYPYPYYPYYPYYSYYSGWGWWGWDWWPSYYFGVGWYVAPDYSVVADAPRDSDVPAIVKTDIHPRKASVRLDGEIVGSARDYSGTWDDLRVAAGWHTLEFSAPGYMTLRVPVNARPGAVYHVGHDLRKGEGIDPRSESLPEPRADATGNGPGAGEGRPDGSRSASLRRGLVKIVANPPDAAVYLDGEFLATAHELSQLHGAISVALGPHRIEAVRPGHPARTVEVNVSAGGTARVHIDLVDGEEPTAD